MQLCNLTGALALEVFTVAKINLGKIQVERDTNTTPLPNLVIPLG